jgi:hypothetical protein
MTADLTEEIKKTNKLLALMATKDLQQPEKIKLLSQVGFGPKDIADLIGTSSNTVAVTLTRLRKAKKHE